MSKSGAYSVVAGGQKTEKSYKERCCTFIWNAEKGYLCGKRPVSWAKLVGYYLIFYSILAGFFAGMLMIVFTFVKEDYPNYHLLKPGMEQHILMQPGLDIIPNILPKDKRSSAIGLGFVNIKFDKDDVTTYQHYLDAFEAYLQGYNASTETFTVPTICGMGDIASTCNSSISKLGPCDYNHNPTMGFDQGEPCILIKLNRIINWKPILHTTAQNIVPPHTDFDVTSIGLSCSELNEKGKVIAPANFNANLTKFYPSTGISSLCYPYCGKVKSPNYLSPLVAIKFVGVTLNTNVGFYCKMWTAGYNASIIDKIGSVKLSLDIKST